MNILHLQFDTEIRTIYQVTSYKHQFRDKIILAYAGESYSTKFHHGNELFDSTINIPNIRLYNTFYLNHSRAVKKVINQVRDIISTEQIDVIHVHKRADLQCYVALKQDLPVIIDAHDLAFVIKDSMYNSNNLILNMPLFGKFAGNKLFRELLNLERTSLKSCNHIIAVSRKMKQDIEDLYDIQSEKITVLPNTVPLSNLSISKRENPKKRVKAILASSFTLNPTACSHRNISPLITMIGKIPRLSLDIYGPILNDTNESVIKRLEKYSNIQYCGMMPPSKYIQKLDHYDVGIIYNNPKFDQEICEMSLPKKLFEYMSHGIPIIANNTNELSTFVEKNEVGVVFNTNSNTSLKKALDKVIKHYIQYSKKAIKVVRMKYNWDRQSKLLHTIYRKAIQ